MAQGFQGNLFMLDCIYREGGCTRCLECRDIRDPEIYCRTHDLVVILPGLLVLGGIDDKADLPMPHHVQHVG